MAVTKVNSEGQITLPEEIRQHLNLKPGQEILMRVESNGTVSIRPVNLAALTRLRGMLHNPDLKPVTVDEMNEAIAEGACDGDCD